MCKDLPQQNISCSSISVVLSTTLAMFFFSATAAMAESYKDLVKNSDDFDRYGKAFTQAAEDLVSMGRCTKGDFREWGGGWFKATGENTNKPLYFMYCGGLHKDNKIYLNAKTGRFVE